MNRIIRHIGVILLYAFFWIAAFSDADAQQIRRIEYFIDADPGQGKADTLIFTSADTVLNTFKIPQKGWTPGTHTLYFRTLDSGGLYSPYYSHIFIVKDSVSPKNIEKVEYFIDRDTGIGASKLVSITPGDTIQKDFTRDIKAFSDGRHFIHTRTFVQNGLWSPWQIHMFCIVDTVEVGIIEEAEYFIDKDNGIGSAIPISIKAADSFNTYFSQDISSLSDGHHFLHVRTKVSSGYWSPWQLHMFYVDDTVEAGSINQLEYFIDKDSGVGKMIPIKITPEDSVKADIQHDISALNDGLHFIHFRTKVASGYWSPWQLHMFYIDDTVQAGPISELEYFIDKDSGVGKNHSVQITPSDSVQKLFNHATNGLTSGLHYVHVRTKVSSGYWSPWQIHMFYLQDTLVRNTIESYSYSIDSSLMNLPFVSVVNLSPPVDSFSLTHTNLTDTSLNYGNHVFRIWAQQTTDLSSVWHFDTFTVIDCPMLDTADFLKEGGLCVNDTVLLIQNITSLGIWPVDSFNFRWEIDGVFKSSNDSFWLHSAVSDTFLVKFSFTRKSDGRCRGEKTQLFIYGGNSRDSNDVFICAGDSAFIHGKFERKDSVYSFKSLSTFGCDSVSIVRLHVVPVSNDSSYLNICQGDSLLIHGQYRKSNGVFTFNTVNKYGCDSISTIILAVHPTYFKSDTISICSGDTLKIHGRKYFQSGKYYDSLKSTFGCDSIFFTRLEVYPKFNVTSSKSICSGDSTLIHGVYRKTSGNYVFSGKSVQQCDSQSTVMLTVNPVYRDTVKLSICHGDSLRIHGIFRNTSGVYVNNATTHLGCDSITTSILTVHPVYFKSDTISICSGDTLKIHGRKYFQSGKYYDSLKSAFGCDSIFFTRLEVYPKFNVTSSKSICSGDSTLIHGVYRKTSGNYVFSGKSVQHCDSQSTVVLTVNPVYRDTVKLSICQGDSLRIHGIFRKTSGVYVNNATTHLGCDSITTSILTVHPVYFKSDTFGICSGDTLNIHGSKYFQSGKYYDSLKSAFGCDSIFFTRLEVYPKFNVTSSKSVCSGDSTLIHGVYRKTSGNYVFSGKSVQQCDSQWTVMLTVNPVYRDTVKLSICQGDSLRIHGIFRKTSGVYVNNATTHLGCDSITTSILTVHPVYFKSDTFGICSGDTLNIHGSKYFQSGKYYDSLKSVFGCDSIFFTKLEVYPRYNDTLYKQICQGDSAFINGFFRSQQGVYTFNGKSGFSCDSISTTVLSVFPVYSDTIRVAICSGDSSLVHGTYEKLSGTYINLAKSVNGCDSTSVIILRLNAVYNRIDSFDICERDSIQLHGKFYSKQGVYTHQFKSISGCDSIFTSHIKVHPIYNNQINVGLCGGDSFFFDGLMRHTSGVYIGNFRTVKGCDSTVTLNLQIENIIQINETVEICPGDSVFIDRAYRKNEGVYTDRYQAVGGCDSLVSRKLVFLKTDTTYLFDSICQAGVLNFHNQQLSKLGIYNHLLKNQRGCDSLLVLNLFVRENAHVKLSSVVCYGDSTYAGKGYKKGNGIFTDTLIDRFGCDSLVELTQSELPLDSFRIQGFICPGDSLFTGLTFKKGQGLFFDTLKSDNGCDSILITEISFKPTSLTEISDTICFNAGLNFFGKVLTEPGVYEHVLVQSNGCDSLIKLNLFRRPQFIPEVVPAGFALLSTDTVYRTYQWYRNRNILPGDTNRFISLTENGIYDVSVTNHLGCAANSWDDFLKAERSELQLFRIYPNPTTGLLYLDLPTDVRVQIYDSRGRKIEDENIRSGLNMLDFSTQKEGIYYISLQNNTMFLYNRFILIK